MKDLQVLVPRAMADGLESIECSSLHFLLDVPHEFRDRREQLDQASSNLNLAALEKATEYVESLYPCTEQKDGAKCEAIPAPLLYLAQ